jgi:hypothetical protein
MALSRMQGMLRLKSHLQISGVTIAEEKNRDHERFVRRNLVDFLLAKLARLAYVGLC